MSVHLHNLRRGCARAADKRHLVTLAVLLLAAALLLFARAAAGAEVGVRVDVAPPPLPVYEQPPLPAPDYLWVPGYWSWGPAGYFWVPGTWMLPPDPDLLWTPGYWSFADGAYLWTPGYWAPQVGFYGGIDYGFGYFGHGYEGGYWRDRQFWYNRTVNNIDKANVTNVYNRTVENVTVNNVSYSGGPGGVDARPTPEEQAAARQPRHAPTREQNAHVTAASENRELLASVNQGHPAVAATPQPNDYSGPGIMPARTGAGTGAVRGAPAHG
ncbi:MAG: YXWGXW repeat-containing protein, partial [Gammaproteobacteria bacterium]|nr:YXWGXW repeat-containing protein [Gammaproteobacteria bacterium]